MQRDAITLDALATRDNLMLATWKAARGKWRRPAVARFLERLDSNLDDLAQAIHQERAPVGTCSRFTILDPKRRVIAAACFADRVLHHAILNLAEPRFERMLVDSCYACRPGKGVHAAVARVQLNTRQDQAWPWVVKVDVDGYFPSINHASLEALLAHRFKGHGFLGLLSRIIEAGSDVQGTGLPIGSLTSQHFANAYLDGADRLLSAYAGVGAHVRYMDDMVWWCDSLQSARASLDALRTWLIEEQQLRLKDNVHIGLTHRGLSFCGFRIRAGVLLASSRKLSRYRAGLRRIDAALAGNHAGQAQAQRAHDGLLATLAFAQTLGLRQRLLSRDAFLSASTTDMMFDAYHGLQGCGS